MMAAAAGYSVKDHTTDYDGVDITIVSSAEYEVYYSPQLELQVKCTSQQDLVRTDTVAWRMEAGPFRCLINPKRFNPAYLAVLIVPDRPDDWLTQNDMELISRSAMYWQRTTDLGGIDDGAATITVKLPRRNLFDVPHLRRIMKSLGEGGEL